jgi:hypothetical protein
MRCDIEKIINNWKKDSNSQSLLPDTYVAKRIIEEVYEAGLIHWNVYIKAVENIQRTRNGTWMFEKQKTI